MITPRTYIFRFPSLFICIANNTVFSLPIYNPKKNVFRLTLKDHYCQLDDECSYYGDISAILLDLSVVEMLPWKLINFYYVWKDNKHSEYKYLTYERNIFNAILEIYMLIPRYLQPCHISLVLSTAPYSIIIIQYAFKFLNNFVSTLFNYYRKFLFYFNILFYFFIFTFHRIYIFFKIQIQTNSPFKGLFLKMLKIKMISTRS